jgi:hypothetical protein
MERIFYVGEQINVPAEQRIHRFACREKVPEFGGLHVTAFVRVKVELVQIKEFGYLFVEFNRDKIPSICGLVFPAILDQMPEITDILGKLREFLIEVILA